MPFGPLRAKLVRGETIVCPDGRTVTPSQVVRDVSERPRVLILDVPTVGHLASLMEATAAGHFDDNHASAPSVVVHLAPASIATSPAYASLLPSFSRGGGGGNDTAATQHIFVNAAASGGEPIFRSAARIRCKLHAVHAGVFPVVTKEAAAADVFTSRLPSSPSAQKSHAGVPEKSLVGAGAGAYTTMAGANMLKFTLVPVAKSGVDSSAVLKPFRFTPSPPHSPSRRTLERTPSSPVSLDTDSAAAAALPPGLAGLARGDVSLTFLGTGAGTPWAACA